jgi:hypothetical protein
MAGYIGSKASVVSSGAERKKTFTITGATTSLTGLNYTVGKVHVFQNGVRLVDGTDYTATNNTTITLTVAAQNGDNVVVISQAAFQVSGAVSTSGDSMTGDLSFGDNDKAKFGVGNDLQVYHDGSNSYIDDAGTGNLYLRASNAIIMQSSDGAETIASFHDDNLCRLYYDNSVKLATTSTGIDVTGTVTSDGLTVDSGVNTETRTLLVNNAHSGGSMYNAFGVYVGGTDRKVTLSADYGDSIMAFKTNNAERMKIDASGAVTMPSQPAFMAVKNAGQLNQAINVYNTVTFGNEVFDRNADYDGSTTFTAPVTGVYQANIKIRIDQVDNQANYYLVRLQTSNRHYYTITDFDGSTGDLTYSTHSFSQLIDMDAGDTAYIQAYQAGGSAQSDYDNDSGSSQFSMFLVA